MSVGRAIIDLVKPLIIPKERSKMLLEKYTASVTTECVCHEEDGIDEVCFGDCYYWQKEDVFALLGMWKERNDVTEDDKILVTGTGMTWQRLSGWKETDILNLDSVLSLDGDFRLEWYLEGNELTARRWSHDEPTGTGLFNFKVFKEEESE